MAEDFKVTRTDAEWRAMLTPEQYDVLRGHGTERPGSCALNHEKRAGVFHCAGCGQKLFRSREKFESGTGWPSFFSPLPGALTEHADTTLGMRRVEVRSASSGIHLGHVFDDGPEPTGLRYCINSASLKLERTGG